MSRLYRSLNLLEEDNVASRKKVKVSSPLNTKTEEKVEESEIKFMNNNDALTVLKIDKMITPWIKKATLTLKNPSLRLHNEIIDFY